jgi:malate dehydrogenase (oxaloacetate-decarboxylating)
MKEILGNIGTREISVIVVTDGERILGLGDLGVGGMGIPIGKLALYTLCGGIHPRKTLPVLLDVGTNNQELLNDPLYLGWRHSRLSGGDYDGFIDHFVNAVREIWPHVLLQWEDFSKANAWRILARYRDRIASFNDDIQGTAAAALSTILRAERSTRRSIGEERIVIEGGGSAATGIADLLYRAMREKGVSQAGVREAVWLIDTRGLIHEGRKDLTAEKNLFAQPLDNVRSKGLDPGASIRLAQVVAQVKPTILIGVSGQPGSFDEPLIRTMASSAERPIILPLSNPTSKSEAAPEDLIHWTDGSALVATGSPYDPVMWKGRRIPVGQCNNVFIFPGVGLGLAASRAKLVPDEIFLAAAKALASLDKRLPGYEDTLLPNLEDVREVSERIAVAVGREVVQRGLSHDSLAEDQIPRLVHEAMWEPVYPKLRLSKRNKG